VDSHKRTHWTLTPDAETSQEIPDLELGAISKRFGKIKALDEASLKVRPHSIHALLGENGAGKTTLMRIAFGMIAPDSGQISVRGKAIQFSSPSDAIAAGIGMVHQQFSLVPEMTVAENVALGARGKYNSKLVADRVLAITERLGVTIDPFKKVKELTASERQKLEIVRSFAHEARTLILDEPTAVLTPQDIGDLFAQLRTFADSGGSVVLITHKLQDAIAHADEVTVLRKGQCVLNAPMITVDQVMLADAMLGKTTEIRVRPKGSVYTKGRTVVELKDVSVTGAKPTDKLSHISLQIHEGEIVGVAALEGAAKPMLRLMAGRIKATSGQVIRPDSVGFVPEDRSQDSVIAEFSLTENMALRNLAARSGRIHWSTMESLTDTVIADYDIRTSGTRASMSELSGGNQQKFVLGRELSDNPRLVVLENPTQGLDVHAAAAIHDRILSIRDQGTAVVIYSSDLDELAAVSDRVIVMSAKSFTITEPDRDLIGRALLSRTD
jgi:simple sugar transport system ATP-binding protein